MEDKVKMKTKLKPLGATNFNQWSDDPIIKYKSKQYSNIKSRYSKPMSLITRTHTKKKYVPEDVQFDEKNIVKLDQNDLQRSIVLKYGIPTLKAAMTKLTIHYDLKTARRKLLPMYKYMYLEMVEDKQFYAASVFEYILIIDNERTTIAPLAPALRENDNLLLKLSEHLKAIDIPENGIAQKVLNLLKLTITFANLSAEWWWVAEYCLLIATMLVDDLSELDKATVLFITGWFLKKTAKSSLEDAASFFNRSRNMSWKQSWRLPLIIQEIIDDGIHITKGPLWTAACFYEYKTLMLIATCQNSKWALRTVQTALKLIEISGPNDDQYLTTFELGKRYYAAGMVDEAIDTFIKCSTACKLNIDLDNDLDLRALLEASKILQRNDNKMEAYKLLETIIKDSKTRRKEEILISAIVEMGHLSIKYELDSNGYFHFSLAYNLLKNGRGREVFNTEDMLVISMHAAALRTNLFLKSNFQSFCNNNFNLLEVSNWWRGNQPLVTWHGDQMVLNIDKIEDDIIREVAYEIHNYLKNNKNKVTKNVLEESKIEENFSEEDQIIESNIEESLHDEKNVKHIMISENLFG
ncbi:uncharacterized protein LOC126902789 [Daktulosphaira vitifoliae]|uniref:uncharacterized protein LOC126902789 n=1 Tax=Daktulosphaira vitifoliae TaxID=58002 RepID=UPI0021A9999E|nr:uncharacterized protein LOC126902789 [Daktulosphaira vitifoliae]